MTEDWIRKHFDEVDWKFASKYSDFSYAFMREFADYLDFNELLQHRDFKLDFIREFKDKIILYKLPLSLRDKILDEYSEYFYDQQWKDMSHYAHLSKKFIKKYAEKLDWYYIIMYQKGIDLKFRMNNLWRCNKNEQNSLKEMFELKEKLGREYW